MAETTRMENAVELFTQQRLGICDSLGGNFGAA